MKIVVLKFGGTSIKNREGFQKSLKHVQKELQLNHKVICVVSAMGRAQDPYSTDTLKNLIKNYVSTKEQDRLLSIGEIISSILFADYLIEHNIKAVSLSTSEIGIITNNKFTDADIIKIEKDTILHKLAEYDCVIVPGFQGVTIDNDITTLGRGGSDTTAIALGNAFQALYVNIISDVKGVFTADPRIVNDAIKLPVLNYDILIDMTTNGSKVLHSKGALLAKEFKTPLRFVAIDDINSYTVVEDTKVSVINLSHKPDYVKYITEVDIAEDYVYSYKNDYYVHRDDEKLLQHSLDDKKIDYIRVVGFSKITIVDYRDNRQLLYHFVETDSVYQKLNELHQKIFQVG
ncbi:MAG TPA: hypothetical protein VIK84_06075 [Haloplasmataceae bacterium]